MTVQDLPIDAKRLAQLEALPYELDVNIDGHLTMTPKNWEGWTYDELAERNVFSNDFKAWRIETNARRQIILMPSPLLDHQIAEGEIMSHLIRLLPTGKTIPEIGVRTADGTKKPDVIWTSLASLRANRSKYGFTRAPELCVEVISPGNTHREMHEKCHLYFEADAREVWLCGEDGTMTFHTAPETIVPRSILCPEFPPRIDPFAT